MWAMVASWAHIGSAEAPESIAAALPEREDGVPAAWYVACLGQALEIGRARRS